MSKVTIEEAEKTPLKLSIRKQLSKLNPSTYIQVWHGYAYYERRRYKNYEIHFNILKKFVSSFVGKPYNKMYSEFIKWVKSERKLRKYPHCIEIHSNLHYLFDSRYPYFSVDTEGLIRKIPQQRYHHEKKIYFYVPDESNHRFKERFIKFFGKKEWEKACNGLYLYQVKEYNLNENFVKNLWYCRKDTAFKTHWATEDFFIKYSIGFDSFEHKEDAIQKFTEYRQHLAKVERLAKTKRKESLDKEISNFFYSNKSL